MIFQKWGEGGSKAVWNFSKNSSDLVAGSFPKACIEFPDFASSLNVSPTPKLNQDYKYFYISNSADVAMRNNNI